MFLAEKFAVPLDDGIEQFHMPQAFGGAVIAALVLSPEGLGGITASLRDQLQRSINILFGSVLATIGLTIPAVLMIGLLTKRSVTLGVQGGDLPLLLLTLAVSVVTFTSQENQRFARVYSPFAALRRFRASDFCALTNEPFAAANPR